MSKTKFIWKAFSSGELSPTFDGQVSFEKYFTGCKREENFLSLVQGPAFNRPGFRFIVKAKYENRKCILRAFDFSTEQAYELEFGHLYIRFVKDRGQILNDDLTPYEITTTYTEEELPELQFVQSNDILYIAHRNHLTAKLSRTSHTSWTLDNVPFIKQYRPTTAMLTSATGEDIIVDSGFDDPAKWTTTAGWAIADGKASHTPTHTGILIPEPQIILAAEDVGNTYKISVVVSNYVADGEANGFTIKFGGAESIVINYDGPHIVSLTAINTDGLIITPKGGGNDTWDIESIIIGGFNEFNSDYLLDGQYTTKGWDNNIDGVGSWLQIDTGVDNEKEFTKIGLFIANAALNSIFDIEYYNGSLWVKAVTGWDLSKEYLGVVEKSWDSVGKWQKWRLIKTNEARAGGNVMLMTFYEVGIPKQWVAGQYPEAITFYEQRMWLASIQTVWASKSGDFYNFTFGSEADSGMEYTIAAQEVNKIQWLSSGKVLVIGTAGGEYKVSASSLEEAITPLNIRIAKQSTIGSTNIQPVSIADVVLYIARSKKKIREFTHNTLEDTYTSPDMTILARHLFDHTIVSMAYQQEPYSILWCVRDDGILLAFTYSRLEGIQAWSQHTTQGKFESVSSCYGHNGNNELYIVVRRFIQDRWVRYIEVLETLGYVEGLERYRG